MAEGGARPRAPRCGDEQSPPPVHEGEDVDEWRLLTLAQAGEQVACGDVWLDVQLAAIQDDLVYARILTVLAHSRTLRGSWQDFPADRRREAEYMLSLHQERLMLSVCEGTEFALASYATRRFAKTLRSRFADETALKGEVLSPARRLDLRQVLEKSHHKTGELTLIPYPPGRHRFFGSEDDAVAL